MTSLADQGGRETEAGKAELSSDVLWMRRKGLSSPLI